MSVSHCTRALEAKGAPWASHIRTITSVNNLGSISIWAERMKPVKAFCAVSSRKGSTNGSPLDQAGFGAEHWLQRR